MELRLPLEVSPGREATCRAVFGTWGFFPDDARASHCPFVLISFTGWSSKRCPGIGFLSRGHREIGVLWNVEPPTRPRLECRRETGLILRCDRKVGNPFQTKQGSRPSCPDQEGRRGSEEVVPASLIVNLKRVHVEHSIYEYIEQQLGYIIDKSHRRIEVHTANETDAALLQIAIGQPVILARQTGRFSTGQVFEYSKATHLGETFSMDVILTRRN